MEPQRSRDLEVWRLWRHGGEVWRSGGRVGMEVWRACRHAGKEVCIGQVHRHIFYGGGEAESRNKKKIL
jgi:hypothetical protein